jgi:transcriptional regulator with XRE-family HTH domain
MTQPIKSSNQIAQWRQKMGLGQQELADYLMVSRSLIALAEQSERSLPSKALLALDALYRRFTEAQEKMHSLQAPNKELLLEHRTELNWNLSKLRKQLSILETQYRQVEIQQEVFSRALSELSAQESSEEQQQQIRWFEIQQIELEKKRKSNTPGIRLRTKLKVEVLEFELQLVEKMLETQS